MSIYLNHTVVTKALTPKIRWRQKKKGKSVAETRLKEELFYKNVTT